MKRIALVNQRYGTQVNGGSEVYTRQLAERLTPFYAVDVITTTSLDYAAWDNEFPPGEAVENGVRILRFPVEQPRSADFDRYNAGYLRRVSAGKRDAAREKRWFEKQGPYAPSAIGYIRSHGEDYCAFLFVTYLYYLTVMGLPEVREKAVFIPTAHEEPFLHFLTYEKLFRMPKRFVFLTPEEQSLVHRLFRNADIPSDVLGTGVDIPETPDAGRFRSRYSVHEDYLIYAGRIDEGKDCPRLFRYFMEYRRRNPEPPLRLVLLGKAACPIPAHPDILPIGFVSEENKFDAISGARALVLPSRFESLSIAVLEAMALSVPVIVNGTCDVLRGHCRRSNAGLYYRSYAEFEGCIRYLLTHPAEYAQLRQNAAAYIARHYRWDAVIERMCSVIEAAAQDGTASDAQPRLQNG